MRLVIPLIGGILISDIIENTGTLTELLCCMLVPVLAMTFTSFLYGDKLARLYGAGLSLSFFLIGALLYSHSMEKVHVRWPDSKKSYTGIVTEWPLERKASYRLDLMLQDSCCYGKKIYLYVPKDSMAILTEPGHRVIFYGSVKEPSNEGVIGFDYASYLYRHGISGTLWVPSDSWRQLPASEKPGLRVKAVRMRRHMFEKYREWGLDGDGLAIVAAVSLGEKRDMDDDLKELYSDSGTSHLLAVSGLHVGIMCSFLYFLFPMFMNRRGLSWIRELIVMTAMWGYAVLIGLPVSITRSLVMFTTLSICRTVGRENSSINSLAFAAAVMLLFDPTALYDIGFQLSFSAVLSILLFEPLISGILKFRSKIAMYVWNLISVSTAAQIGTAPLVIYSFSGFPTYFLITNLFAIPIMFVIVSLSMVLWGVCWIPVLRIVVVKLLSFLIYVINGIMKLTVSLPASRIELTIDEPWKVWAIYAIMFLLYRWIVEKRIRRFVQALSVVAIWCTVVLLLSFWAL
jgi:competence protein ComEC